MSIRRCFPVKSVPLSWSVTPSVPEDDRVERKSDGDEIDLPDDDEEEDDEDEKSDANPPVVRHG